jgi:hypothetical protein
MRDHRKFSLWGIARVIVLAATLPLTGHGQERTTTKDAELPSGPPLKPAPPFSSWTVTFSYPQDRPTVGTDQPPKSPPPNSERKVATTRTEKIIQEVTVSVSGEEFSKWQIGEMFYVKPPSQSFWGECDERFVIDNPTSDPRMLPVPESGFRNLEWIDKDTFAGRLESAGNEYLIFIPGGGGGAEPHTLATLRTLPRFALVNAKTRLPSYVKDLGHSRTYVFATPPAEMQKLPADLLQEIQEGKERRAQVFRAPKKEY